MVIIDNFEMPVTCFDCPMSDYGALERCALVDSIISENNRLDECPFIEVKSHGRLIDADKLLSSFKKTLDDTKAAKTDIYSGADVRKMTAIDKQEETLIHACLVVKAMPSVLDADNNNEAE